MIHGIGVDILRIERMQHSWERFGMRFAQRILHEREMAEFRAAGMRAAYLAKAFAIKEAFGKALGTGIRGFAFHDVGAVRNRLGAPQLVFAPDLDRQLRDQRIVAGHVSLSDEAGLVCAMVVLERD